MRMRKEKSMAFFVSSFYVFKQPNGMRREKRERENPIYIDVIDENTREEKWIYMFI